MLQPFLLEGTKRPRLSMGSDLDKQTSSSTLLEGARVLRDQGGQLLNSISDEDLERQIAELEASDTYHFLFQLGSGLM